MTILINFKIDLKYTALWNEGSLDLILNVNSIPSTYIQNNSEISSFSLILLLFLNLIIISLNKKCDLSRKGKKKRWIGLDTHIKGRMWPLSPILPRSILNQQLHFFHNRDTLKPCLHSSIKEYSLTQLLYTFYNCGMTPKNTLSNPWMTCLMHSWFSVRVEPDLYSK